MRWGNRGSSEERRKKRNHNKKSFRNNVSCTAVTVQLNSIEAVMARPFWPTLLSNLYLKEYYNYK
jgi:hypothetical protein